MSLGQREVGDREFRRVMEPSELASVSRGLEVVFGPQDHYLDVVTCDLGEPPVVDVAPTLISPHCRPIVVHHAQDPQGMHSRLTFV